MAAETLSAELVRAIRGRRSCAQLSRKLGYRSNIVRRWEAGECWPSASTFLTACAKLRPSTTRLFHDFFQRTPDWFDPGHPFGPASIAAFLRQLRGRTPVGVLAEYLGMNRYSVGRYLSGKTMPDLPELLRLVDAMCRRSLDLVSFIVDPAELPSVAAEWTRLRLAREAAYTWPWSHAVLRALELDGEGKGRDVDWLAERLGISVEDVERGLDILGKTGQIEIVRGRARVARVVNVDTSSDAMRARQLKIAWTEVALDRLRRGKPGNFGYSVFAVSREDLRKLRELHLEYIRAMQSLIARSSPAESVGLYCAQLLDLGTEDNALVPRLAAAEPLYARKTQVAKKKSIVPRRS